MHTVAFTASSAAGVFTAIASVITAAAVLIGAFTVLLPVLRTVRRTEARTAQVHTIVNQQRTDFLRYQSVLVNALHAAGIDVPPDQSIILDTPDPGPTPVTVMNPGPIDVHPVQAPDEPGGPGHAGGY